MTDKQVDYRSTLNLPDTPFPMRGDLPKREPAWIKEWNEEGLYKKLRDARAGAATVCAARRPALRERPDCTWATHVNKVLKDMIVKSKQLAGFDAQYIPGWDCHGLAHRKRDRESCTAAT